MSDQFRARWDKLRRTETARKADYRDTLGSHVSHADKAILNSDVDFQKCDPTGYSLCLEAKQLAYEDIESATFKFTTTTGTIVETQLDNSLREFAEFNQLQINAKATKNAFNRYQKLAVLIRDMLRDEIRRLPVASFASVKFGPRVYAFTAKSGAQCNVCIN